MILSHTMTWFEKEEEEDEKLSYSNMPRATLAMECLVHHRVPERAEFYLCAQRSLRKHYVILLLCFIQLNNNNYTWKTMMHHTC